MKLEKKVKDIRMFIPLCMNYKDLQFDEKMSLIIFGYAKGGAKEVGKDKKLHF
jgi:hypothetical protein